MSWHFTARRPPDVVFCSARSSAIFVGADRYCCITFVSLCPNSAKGGLSILDQALRAYKNSDMHIFACRGNFNLQHLRKKSTIVSRQAARVYEMREKSLDDRTSQCQSPLWGLQSRSVLSAITKNSVSALGSQTSSFGSLSSAVASLRVPGATSMSLQAYQVFLFQSTLNCKIQRTQVLSVRLRRNRIAVSISTKRHLATTQSLPELRMGDFHRLSSRVIAGIKSWDTMKCKNARYQ